MNTTTWRITFYSIVLGLVTLWLGPFSIPRACVALAATLMALGAGLALDGAARRRFPVAMRWADLALMNCCLLVVASELGLRTVARLAPNPLLSRSSDSTAAKVRANRVAPGALHYDFPVNSLGDWDTEPRVASDDDCLLVAIGDSFSFGTVPHERHFTSVAERSLPECEIYNMGTSAIGPPEYAFLLEHQALAMNPRVIVINLFIGNDLTDSIPARPTVRRLDRWIGRDSMLALKLPGRLLELWRESRRPVSSGVGAARESSRPGQSLPPWLDDPLLEPPRFSEAKFSEIELLRARYIAVADAQEFAFPLEDLGRIRDASRGTRLLFMLIPDEFQVEDPLWNEILSNLSGHIPDRDRPQRFVTDWLRANGIPFLDLLPVLRAVPPLADGKRHLYHLRDTHFNSRGNAIAGEALGRMLRPYVGELLDSGGVPATAERTPIFSDNFELGATTAWSGPAP